MDVKDQFFERQQHWGLSDWERILSISVKDGATIKDRRTQILLKLQGANVVSKAFIINLVNNFLSDNSGNIVQHNNDYYFDICFNNGSLFDWEGLQEAIETYKPAHLGVKYFALQNVDSNIYVGGAVNNIEQIEIGAEEDYSIDPITAPISIYNVATVAEQIEIGSDNVIDDTNINIDTDNIIYGLFDVVDQIEI